MLVWLANNGNPPTGKTGAQPFDGNCNDCHSGSAYNATIDVLGFPATADPDATYDISFTVTATLGAPTKAGFQLVVVDANDDDCGDLIPANGQTGTESFSGREYIEHRGGKTFAGGVVSWDFKWKAPMSVPGNTVKVYYISNLCNGNGGTGGDNPVWENLSFAFAGSPPLSASISSSTNPACNGASTGSATVEATGGNLPYTYLWSGGGQTGQTATNLMAGTYTVTVTGAGGSGTITAVATLTQPPALTLTTSVSGSVSCITTASATATAGGGTPDYTFLWSDGQTSSTVFFDQPGVYTVTATDDNGCTKVATVNITGNTTAPTAVAGPAGVLTCLVTQIQLNGAGSSAGSNFNYLWTATSGGNIVSGATTLTPTVNQCGTYTLKVTNTTNGCTASSTVAVTCVISPPNATAIGATITCTTPGVVLMGNSTTLGVTYSWSGSGITPANQNQQNPTVDQAGTYTLTVTDPANGCSKTATATVLANTTPPTAVGSVSSPLTCSITSVQLNLTTNVPNAVFAWTGPNSFDTILANPSVLIPGDYFGIVTNLANGCKSFDTITVLQNIAPPGATAAADGQITCVNDSVQLNGNSPLEPNVTYFWTSQNFSSSLQNPRVDTAGTYLLTVIGLANGCTSSAVATVGQNIAVPFDSIVKPGNLNCNNASIQLNATPSSQGSNFDYLWTAKNGGHIISGDSTLTPVVDSIGKYFLQITNTENGCTTLDSVVLNLSPTVTASIISSSNVGCNGGSNGTATASGGGGNGVFSVFWSNGDTIATTTGLTAGTYIAIVTDGENCTASVSITITQPDPLLANAAATGETVLGANNGMVTANPTGGTIEYTYVWSNGATNQTIMNLMPGSYTVIITDANGCTAIQTVTVNSFGCNLAATVASTNASCNGANDGQASVNLTGAVNPVSYTWSNGSTTQNVNNLATGVYTISVMDGNNCPAVLSASIGEPPVLSANASATGLTALGANDGTATANPAGGTPGYTYVWSNNATTQSISGLEPGVYMVVVTDEKGCTSAQTVTVLAFNCALLATITSAEVSCFGGSDGQATIAVLGGTLPYSYLWSNGTITQTATNLAAGTFTAIATDAGGCVVTQSVSIGQPTLLVAELMVIQNVVCPDDETGQVAIQVQGGVPPYTFTWPGGNTGGFAVGSYTVSLTDANGCSTTVSFEIISTDTEAPTLTCPASIQVCGENQVNYGLPAISDNCGVEVLPIVISGPSSGSTFSVGTTSIVYQAMDASGNTGTCSFSIIVYAAPTIAFDNVSNDVNGQGIGEISITVTGSGPFQFFWSKNGQPFATTEDLVGLSEGVYTLEILDNNSCISIVAATIGNTVGINEPGLIGSIRLWPNPAQSAIQLEIIDLDVIAASIVDLRGGLVQQIQPSALNDEIEIQQLPAGMYCLKISTANGRVLSLKFFIQR